MVAYWRQAGLRYRRPAPLAASLRSLWRPEAGAARGGLTGSAGGVQRWLWGVVEKLPGWVRFSPSFCSPLFCPVRSYIRYSQICAQVVRAAMKPQYKAEAERAAMATVKTVKPKKE